MKQHLPLIISNNPIPVWEKKVKPGENLAIQRADDEFLVICDYYPSINYTTGELFLLTALLPLLQMILNPGDYNSSNSAGASIIFFVAAFLYFWKSKTILFMFPVVLLIFLFNIENADSPIFPFTLFNLSLAALAYLYGFTMPKKKLIFDRQQGLFTYPGFMWGKATTVPFKDAKIKIRKTIGNPSHCVLEIKHANGITGASLENSKLYNTHILLETLSRYVWYMDKNRPLPPGTAFDPYRRKDYERRKKAGFPPPLYNSVIPTPEDPKEMLKKRFSDPFFNYYG